MKIIQIKAVTVGQKVQASHPNKSLHGVAVYEEATVVKIYRKGEMESYPDVVIRFEDGTEDRQDPGRFQ